MTFAMGGVPHAGPWQSDTSLTTPYLSLFAWHMLFHSFTFILFVSLNLKRVSLKGVFEEKMYSYIIIFPSHQALYFIYVWHFYMCYIFCSSSVSPLLSPFALNTCLHQSIPMPIPFLYIF